MLLVVGFFWAAFAKPKLVPGKLQLVGELGYNFVARSIAREVIGKKGDKYVPFLTSIFFFVWIMNVMSIIPLAQFPVASRFAFPVGLAALVFVTYMFLTFKTHGFRGGVKNLVWIEGLPKPLVPLIVLLEFIQNVITRPFTLAVRLWANMFAGHMLIVMFSVASWYLLTPSLCHRRSGRVVRAGRRHDRLRAADPVPPGVRLHAPRLHLHQWSARRGPLSPRPPHHHTSAGKPPGGPHHTGRQEDVCRPR